MNIYIYIYYSGDTVEKELEYKDLLTGVYYEYISRLQNIPSRGRLG
jgi:hypothetical protein